MSTINKQTLTLSNFVHDAVEKYLAQMEGHNPVNIYPLVLQEIEVPLLKVIMRHVNNNQSRAATILGLSRGTLGKKLKQYKIKDK